MRLERWVCVTAATTCSEVRHGEGLDLDAAIVDLVSRGAVKVPPYPAVALQLDALVKREDYGLDELIRLVASDQALAADALRCANSAFYARGSPVSSLPGAVCRIGSKELVRLALASGLGSISRGGGALASMKRSVWQRALASAAVAQELARSRDLAPDEAFACGLLHDFGEVVAIACVEELLEGTDARAMPAEHWDEVVKRYHIELGLVLAARWNLPPLISDVVSLHHSGAPQGAAEPAMVELVAAADEVVALLDVEAHLPPERLGALSALSERECKAVARVLERLPGFIASFEGAARTGLVEKSLVEPLAVDELMAGPTPVRFPVTVTVNRVVHAYQAMGIASNNLMVWGEAPLPDNVLAELKLGCEPPLTCWGTAKLSWKDGEGHTVLLQPFALNGPAQTIWKDLVRATTA